MKFAIALQPKVDEKWHLARVAQKILVDGDLVEDAVAWGQAEMEKLAAKE